MRITENVTATMEAILASKGRECGFSPCTNANCKFAHPKLCNDGVLCKLIKDAEHCKQCWHGSCPFGKACKNNEASHRRVRHSSAVEITPAAVEITPAAVEITPAKTAPKPAPGPKKPCKYGSNCKNRNVSCTFFHEGSQPSKEAGESSVSVVARPPKPTHKPKKFGEAFQDADAARESLLLRSGISVKQNLVPKDFAKLKTVTATLIGREPCQESERSLYTETTQKLGVEFLTRCYSMKFDDKAYGKIIKLLAIATGQPPTQGKELKTAKPKPRSASSATTEQSVTASDEEPAPIDPLPFGEIKFGRTSSESWSDQVEAPFADSLRDRTTPAPSNDGTSGNEPP